MLYNCKNPNAISTNRDRGAPSTKANTQLSQEGTAWRKGPEGHGQHCLARQKNKKQTINHCLYILVVIIK